MSIRDVPYDDARDFLLQIAVLHNGSAQASHLSDLCMNVYTALATQDGDFYEDKLPQLTALIEAFTAALTNCRRFQ